MLQTISLVLMIAPPTSTFASSATLIDNIFMSIPDETVSGRITCDISVDLPVFIIIKNVFAQSNPHYQSVLNHTEIKMQLMWIN